MTNQCNIWLAIYCHILQLIYIHSYASYTTRYAYLHVSGRVTLRTIYIVQYIAILVCENTIYCNTHVRQYNIWQYTLPAIQYVLQYSPPTIQHIAICVTENYNILYCQDSPIQYIINNILQYIE